MKKKNQSKYDSALKSYDIYVLDAANIHTQTHMIFQ